VWSYRAEIRYQLSGVEGRMLRADGRCPILFCDSWPPPWWRSPRSRLRSARFFLARAQLPAENTLDLRTGASELYRRLLEIALVSPKRVALRCHTPGAVVVALNQCRPSLGRVLFCRSSDESPMVKKIRMVLYSRRVRGWSMTQVTCAASARRLTTP